MLSDAQIERYARQIVLPEVGGRGQERLLAARVGLFVGSDAELARDTAALCALHLGAAGVGGLKLDGARANVALAIEARNPEIRLLDEDIPLDATIAFGDRAALEGRRATVFGGADATRAVVALPRGLCPACLSAALPALEASDRWSRTLPPLLASLVAALAIRELLGLDERERPILVTVGLARAEATTTTLTARVGCAECRAQPHPSTQHRRSRKSSRG